jgi:hypothetical protein
MLKTINRNNIVQHLLEYELWLSGHKLVNLIDTTNYRADFTIDWEQYNSFRGYAVPLLKKVFRCNRKKAEAAFIWFWKNFGVRIKNE